MPRLDLMGLFKRGRKPQEVFAERDKALVEWAQSDGYKALLDLYEREFRGVVMAILAETDIVKRDRAIAHGQAIYALIRRIDEKAATMQAAESMADFVKRQVEEMPADRQELQELDRAIMERALAAPDAQRPASRPAMRPVY